MQSYDSLKILLVDDHDGTRRMLQQQLLKLSHEVTLASTALEALDILSNRPDIELLITDWMMPDVSGIELCRLARSMDRPRYLYALVLTVREEESDLHVALEAGADWLVWKDLDRSRSCRHR